MYLSRVEVDRNNRQKIAELTHLGAYHNWVEQSFPIDPSASARPRHLWRLDQLGGKQYLLVVSETKPDLEALERYGKHAQTKDYDAALSAFKVGQRFRFRLVANPSYSVPRPDAKHDRIYPHVTIAQQREWLMEKSVNHGFTIPKAEDGTPQFDIVARDYPVLHRKKGRAVKLSRVAFEGELEITDRDQFIHAMTAGIGREKAYGMGMLTVIPLRQG